MAALKRNRAVVEACLRGGGVVPVCGAVGEARSEKGYDGVEEIFITRIDLEE